MTGLYGGGGAADRGGTGAVCPRQQPFDSPQDRHLNPWNLGPRPAGTLAAGEAAGGGFVVTVSDTPCAAGKSCAPQGHACAVVGTVSNCDYSEPRWSATTRSEDLCPVRVNCHGARGKYVRVHLPGRDRIFSAAVEVARAAPKRAPAGARGLACYGVEARVATEIEPEYITSTDPEDPVFYSTCYVRDRQVAFAPTPWDNPPAPEQWRFHGQCLDCGSFEANKALAAAGANASMRAPAWKMDARCVDCDRTLRCESESGALSSCVVHEKEEGGGTATATATGSGATHSVGITTPGGILQTKGGGKKDEDESGDEESDTVTIAIVIAASVVVSAVVARLWCSRTKKGTEKASKKKELKDALKRTEAAKQSKTIVTAHPVMAGAHPVMSAGEWWYKTRTATPRQREYEYNRTTGETRWLKRKAPQPEITVAQWLKAQTSTPRHRTFEYEVKDGRATGKNRWPQEKAKKGAAGTWTQHNTPRGTHAYEVNSKTKATRWSAKQPEEVVMQSNPMMAARRRKDG